MQKIPTRSVESNPEANVKISNKASCFINPPEMWLYRTAVCSKQGLHQCRVCTAGANRHRRQRYLHKGTNNTIFV